MQSYSVQDVERVLRLSRSTIKGLIDGGFLTVPTFGIYTVDGKWVVENEGVAPDIEVVDDPGKMLDGGDPQLERAIAEVLKSLETKKPAQPRPPAYPNRSGR